jgi:hypothetical protein
MKLRTRLAAVVVSCALGSVHAASQTFAIDAHVVSAGSSVHSSSACFRLQATIAEPVAGYSSSTDYSIIAGYRAVTQNTGSDEILFSGFEDCTP